MRKRMSLLVLAGTMTLSLWGCKSQEQKKPEEAATVGITINLDEEEVREEGQKKEEQSGENQREENRKREEEQEESDFSFADLRGVEFVFSSGAGGWQTAMTVREDGSFSGVYFDGEMGDTGEDYPNGSMYWSDFSGQFTRPVQEDDYTYSVEIAALEYEHPLGEEEIRDGVRYCYTDVYGLDGTEKLLIRLPGSPLEALSEEVRSWIGYYDLSQTTDKSLPFYVLENEQQGYGFQGHDMITDLKEMITFTESQVEALEASIQNDPLSQTELTEKTEYIYELWDQALNNTWQS